MQMLQYSIDDHSKKVYEVFRVCQDIKYGWNSQYFSQSNSIIALKVDRRIQLCGIGLFGSKNHRHLTFKVKVSNGKKESLLDQGSFLQSNGSYHPVKFLFSNPITLEANKKYTINANITGGETFWGANFSPNVHCNDQMPFKVTHLNTFTGIGPGTLGTFTEGQIPSLYFSKFI